MESESTNGFDGIIGHSAQMRAVADMILKIAPNGFAVLICGESGTGKELIARSIQRNSQRVKGPFLPVNCGAIPESLIEAHLFGYQKGSFTGAQLINLACSRRPTEAPSSLMKSEKCPRRCRSNSLGPYRKKR